MHSIVREDGPQRPFGEATEGQTPIAISNPGGDTALVLSQSLFHSFADWLELRLGPVGLAPLTDAVADARCRGASVETAQFHQDRDRLGCLVSAYPTEVVVVAAWSTEAVSLGPVLAYDPIRITEPLYIKGSRGTNLMDDMRLLVSLVN
jgi:PHD/YefM family antitoxin component YafN of YafNO toxin-antitoxin module